MSEKKKKGRWSVFNAASAVVGAVGNAASVVGEGVGIIKETEDSDGDGDGQEDDFNEEDDLVSIGTEDDLGDDEDGDDEINNSIFKNSDGSPNSVEVHGRRESITLRSHMKLDENTKLPIAGSTMEWRRRENLQAKLQKRIQEKKVTKGWSAKEKSTTDEDDEIQPQEKCVWCPGIASDFKLRVGPNYKKTGAKAPSGPSLFDLMGMDIYYSTERIENIASKVALPDEWTSMETNHPDVPPVFVVNGQVPEVSLGSSVGSFFVDKSDGPGWNYVLYFRLSSAVAEQLKDPESASPAVKLFLRYCQNAHKEDAYAEPSSEWYGRFKVVPMVDNLDSLNLPAFISGYNAKPALIAKCGKFFKNEGKPFMGFDANVHAFGGLARSALGVLEIEDMIMEWGVCLESREEEEMPEVLIGANYLVHALNDHAVYWQNWTQEGKIRNQTLGCRRKRQKRRAAERRSSRSPSKGRANEVTKEST